MTSGISQSFRCSPQTPGCLNQSFHMASLLWMGNGVHSSKVPSYHSYVTTAYNVHNGAPAVKYLAIPPRSPSPSLDLVDHGYGHWEGSRPLMSSNWSKAFPRKGKVVKPRVLTRLLTEKGSKPRLIGRQETPNASFRLYFKYACQITCKHLKTPS